MSTAAGAAAGSAPQGSKVRRSALDNVLVYVTHENRKQVRRTHTDIQYQVPGYGSRAQLVHELELVLYRCRFGALVYGVW